MKRDLVSLGKAKHSNCCPGHDQWPSDSYRNSRSKRARSRDIKKEHRYVRRILKHRLKNESQE